MKLAQLSVLSAAAYAGRWHVHRGGAIVDGAEQRGISNAPGCHRLNRKVKCWDAASNTVKDKSTQFGERREDVRRRDHRLRHLRQAANSTGTETADPSVRPAELLIGLKSFRKRAGIARSRCVSFS